MTPTEAYQQLTAMFSHRGDGIPTQLDRSQEIRDAAEALYRPFPQWFELAIMHAFSNGGSLVLTNKQIGELADAVLQPCFCNGPHVDCLGLGYLPR